MEKKVKKKKKLSRSAMVLMISSIIILIPCLVFGGILLISAMQNDKPVLGSRYDNDLNPAITETNTANIKSSIESLSNVESVEIVMTTAQYRINVDTNDTVSHDQVKEIAEQVYDVVTKELPVSTYFTKSSDGMKMYDLSVTVYNYIPDGSADPSWYSYVITKNSSMADKQGQYVSEAQDENLAAELRGEATQNTDTDDTNEQKTSE